MDNPREDIGYKQGNVNHIKRAKPLPSDKMRIRFVNEHNKTYIYQRDIAQELIRTNRAVKDRDQMEAQNAS